MKRNEIPTVFALSLFSWLITVLGVLFCGYSLFFVKPLNAISVILALLTLLGSILFATMVRVLGNIGQFLFDILATLKQTQIKTQGSLEDILEQNLSHYDSLREGIDSLREGIDSLREGTDSLREGTDSLHDVIHEVSGSLENVVEEINCDTKDINQSMLQIKGFFEEIEKRLDLRK